MSIVNTQPRCDHHVVAWLEKPTLLNIDKTTSKHEVDIDVQDIEVGSVCNSQIILSVQLR